MYLFTLCKHTKYYSEGNVSNSSKFSYFVLDSQTVYLLSA